MLLGTKRRLCVWVCFRALRVLLASKERWVELMFNENVTWWAFDMEWIYPIIAMFNSQTFTTFQSPFTDVIPSMESRFYSKRNNLTLKAITFPAFRSTADLRLYVSTPARGKRSKRRHRSWGETRSTGTWGCYGSYGSTRTGGRSGYSRTPGSQRVTCKSFIQLILTDFLIFKSKVLSYIFK